jgi:hypothetical protein
MLVIVEARCTGANDHHVFQPPVSAGWRILGSVFVDTKMEQNIWFFGKE